MPRYKVTTNAGDFLVETNQPPQSQEELMSAVETMISQQGGQMRVPPQQSQILKPGEFVDPQSGQIKSIVARAAPQNADILNRLFEASGEAVGEPVRAGTFALTGSPDISAALGTVANVAGPGLITGLGGRTAIGTAKGVVKAAGKFFAPGATRTAGVEAAIEKLGAQPDAIKRALAVPKSKAAFQMAEAQAPLPNAPLIEALETVAQATGKALPNRPALRAIEATTKNLRPPIVEPPPASGAHMAEFLANQKTRAKELTARLQAQPTTASYRDVINEVHGLRSQAQMAFDRGNSTAGTTLSKAAAALIDKMDDISPAIKQANALYRREQSIEKIHKVLSNPRPDVKFAELLIKDPLVRGIIPEQDAKFLEKIAGQIATIGTQASPYSGVSARVVNAFATPFSALAASSVGRKLLRQTFKDPEHLTLKNLTVAAPLLRGYVTLLERERGEIQ